MQRSRTPIVAAALALLAIPFAARAQDEAEPETAAPPTARITDAKGQFSLEVPVAWKAQVIESTAKLERLTMEIKAANSPIERPFFFTVYHLFEGAQTPLAQALLEFQSMERDGCENVTLVREPFVYVHGTTVSDDGRWLRATAPSIIRGHLISTTVDCPEDTWKAMRPTFHTVAPTVEHLLGHNPPQPESYERVARDGYLYLVHPDVSPKAVSPVHKVVKRHEKAFAKRHGKVVKTKENPPVIYLHARQSDAKAISAKAAETAGPHYGSPRNGCLFVTPLPREDAAIATAQLVEQIDKVFLGRRYAGGEPEWMFRGEHRGAFMTERTGKKLPAIPSNYREMPDRLGLLRELPVVRNKNYTDFDGQAFVYVTFFRTGPSKYRKAYTAFLEEFAETGDWIAAQKTHLFALDEEKLLAAATKFLGKAFKRVNPR